MEHQVLVINYSTSQMLMHADGIIGITYGDERRRCWSACVQQSTVLLNDRTSAMEKPNSN